MWEVRVEKIRSLQERVWSDNSKKKKNGLYLQFKIIYEKTVDDSTSIVKKSTLVNYDQ